MAQKTQYGPKDVARAIKTRKLDAKRVRAWVRDNVARFDDDGYTAHQYSAAEFRTIVAGLSKSTASQRSRAASTGRSGPAKAKVTRKSPVRAMGSGPVPAGPAATSETR